MPQVPFSGTQQVAPAFDPTPRYTADVRPESFGVNVANAINGMGKTLDSVGGEMFARGLAMQDLNNHTAAQEADVSFMQKAGDIKAKLDAMQGNQAVQYYAKGFNEDLTTARKSVRDSLPNDMARKLFDSQSLSTVGRSLFNGAGHAATENKKYAVGTADARITENSNQALANPEDEVSFRQSVTNTENQIRAKSQLLGQSPDQEQLAVEVAKSDLWAQRIKGLAKKDPIAAGKMQDEASKGGILQGDDIVKTANYVQTQQTNVGSRMIAKQVGSGDDLFWGSGVVSAPRAREAVASFEGKYWTVGPKATDSAGTTGNGLGRYQVMSYNLQPWLKEAGMPSMTPEEFLKDHVAQDKLFDFKFGQYQEKYGSFNTAVKAWFGGPGSANADPNKLSDHYHSGAQYLSATNKVLARSAGLEEKYQRGEQIASASAPDNTQLPEAVRTQILGNHNRDVAAEKNEIFTTKNTLLQAIAAVNGGKKPTSVEEMVGNKPELVEAWDKLGRLDPYTKNRYSEMLANNSKDDYGPSDMATVEVSKMKAFAEDHPAEFVQMDMAKWRDKYEIPRGPWGKMIDLQAEKNRNPDVKDLATEQAMRYLAPTLPPDFNDKANRDDRLLFKGALMDQLQDYYQQNKKPMGIEEIKKVGAQLLSQQHSSQFWFSSSKDSLYKLPVPSKVIEDAKKLDPTLDDKAIGRLYIQKQYQELFQKKKAAP